MKIVRFQQSVIFAIWKVYILNELQVMNILWIKSVFFKLRISFLS